MKKLLLTNLFLLVCLIYTPALLGSVHAASLRFDKTSVSAASGSTFDVQIIIDPGAEQVTSTDAWIIYDKNILSVSSVKDGGYFPTVLNESGTAGKVYVAGMVNDPSEFKTGVGTVATITFRANANGNTLLSYQCSTTATETSKIIKNDINSSNIIDCTTNGQNSVTISNAGGGTVPTAVPGLPTATPGPSTTPTMTLTPSPTFILPSPTVASISATPSALPQSGVIENIANIALPGILLIAIGSVLKVLLKI
jgi:hypothetical protein